MRSGTDEVHGRSQDAVRLKTSLGGDICEVWVETSMKLNLVLG
jgi:hypothetical protein